MVFVNQLLIMFFVLVLLLLMFNLKIESILLKLVKLVLLLLFDLTQVGLHWLLLNDIPQIFIHGILGLKITCSIKGEVFLGRAEVAFLTLDTILGVGDQIVHLGNLHLPWVPDVLV